MRIIKIYGDFVCDGTKLSLFLVRQNIRDRDRRTRLGNVCFQCVAGYSLLPSEALCHCRVRN